MHPLRTRISLLAVAALALSACGGDDDSASPQPTPGPTAAADPAPADPGGSTTEAPAPPADAGGATYTAGDICSAIDPADVEAQIAPVLEVQQVDDKYCTIVLDREGMGNNLNISIEQPIEGLGMDDPAVLYGYTVDGRAIMAGDVESVPVDGIGDEAAAIPGDAGDVIVTRIGATVAIFDPFLAGGAKMTADMWRAVLAPAIERL